MLERAGVPFATVSSDLDEDRAKRALQAKGRSAAEIAAGLAELKALGAGLGGASRGAAGDLVLGADQTLELDDGTLLDKPGSRAEAFDQLKRMSGSTHRLHSAAAIAQNGAIVWGDAQSVALSMRPLGEGFLNAYLDREYESIRWSVGCYRIEDRGAQLFDRIEGSHFAILGLPLLPLLAFLRAQGVIPQ